MNLAKQTFQRFPIAVPSLPDAEFHESHPFRGSGIISPYWENEIQCGRFDLTPSSEPPYNRPPVDYFNYVRGDLLCEDVPAERIAREHGTPCYVYSSRTVREHYGRLRDAFAPAATLESDPVICYSVKANSNLSILKLMRDLGSGFDVVSGGELFRALKVGADPRKIVFAGVGKTVEEFRYALENDILLFNVESEPELEVLDRMAGSLRRKAQAALRVNPDVDPDTHTYIATGKKETKFGVDLVRARRILERLADFPNVEVCALHCHIGSQITKVDPYVETLERVERFLPEAAALGARIRWLDMGGGFGIWYKEKTARSAAEIAKSVLPILHRMQLRLLLEPGRFIVGNAGILLTRVLYVKVSGDKRFLICDAGMNDLIRPTLYGAYHRVWPARMKDGHSGEPPSDDGYAGEKVLCDVVGPICESGDFFAKDRPLPPVEAGDLLAVFSAGAYGYSMASNYNSHPRPVEVVVAGDRAWLATGRETYEDLIRHERIVSLE